jgi:hypothetical protein
MWIALSRDEMSLPGWFCEQGPISSSLAMTANLRRRHLSDYSRRENGGMALRRHAHQETNLLVEDVGLFPRSTCSFFGHL